jgi:nicotianamine synthase
VTLAQPIVDLTRVDLREQITTLHSTLNRQPDREPGPAVNALFTDLVRICEYRTGEDVDRVLTDPGIVALTPSLQQLCAEGEFLMERAWAQRIIGADDPDRELAAFPYLANYQELTTLEMHLLAGVGLDLQSVRRACFLGGGPLPHSALMMARRLSAPVDVVDLSAEATILGSQVAERVSSTGSVHFHQADAVDFDGVADSDVVVLAALVGLEREVKRRVLDALSDRMRAGSMLVVRSSHGLRTLLYPPLELSDLHGWRPLAVVHPLNAVVNSVVVAVHQ